MRKRIFFLLLTAMITALAGCGIAEETAESERKVTVSSPTVDDILKERTTDEADAGNSVEDTLPEETKPAGDAVASDSNDTSTAPPPEAADEDISLSSIEGVDIDLTALSSTIVYSQVYNMMFYPENFIGKTIRMEGMYSDYLDMATGRHYFGCIIQDATACCAQGVEFEPTDSYSYPDDYPEDGDNVVVEGVFDLYEEDGETYCTLRNANFIP